MDKATSYREQLLYYLDKDEEQEAMLDWIEDQPELDQPDILREMEVIFKDRYLKTGEKDWLEKANFIANGIPDFEDEILDKKLDIALLMMQFDKVELETEKVILFLIEARKGIIKTILSNPENIKEVKKLAQLAIKLEKDTGIYDPANWIEIL